MFENYTKLFLSVAYIFVKYMRLVGSNVFLCVFPANAGQKLQGRRQVGIDNMKSKLNQVKARENLQHFLPGHFLLRFDKNRVQNYFKTHFQPPHGRRWVTTPQRHEAVDVAEKIALVPIPTKFGQCYDLSSIANYRPFFSSFRHIPLPLGELCRVS